MVETELRSVILEDLERLKEDVNEYIKARRKDKYSGYVCGTVCSKCKSHKTTVTDSRDEGGYRVRRRICRGCGKKWTTIEVMHY